MRNEKMMTNMFVTHIRLFVIRWSIYNTIISCAVLSFQYLPSQLMLHENIDTFAGFANNKHPHGAGHTARA
jgi:hypothetical protein